jgi:hypothetical protein
MVGCVNHGFLFHEYGLLLSVILLILQSNGYAQPIMDGDLWVSIFNKTLCQNNYIALLRSTSYNTFGDKNISTLSESRTTACRVETANTDMER